MDETTLRHELLGATRYTTSEDYFNISTEDIEITSESGEVVHLTSLIPTFNNPMDIVPGGLAHEMFAAALNELDLNVVSYIKQITKDCHGQHTETIYRSNKNLPGDWWVHSALL